MPYAGNNRIPLIGFSGSPFTLACYMVEGGSSSNYRKVKEMMYRRPDLFNEILEKNTDAVIAYLKAAPMPEWMKAESN